MKKRRLVILICLLLTIFLIESVLAEKIGIDVKNSYLPGETINFKITVYDDSNNKIEGVVSYTIIDSKYDLMDQGKVNSGEEKIYKLPDNAVQGPWEISATYKDIQTNSIFTVGESKKIDIKLEGNELIIKNLGNTPYDNNILISIGDNHQTARVTLDVGWEKRIKLSAPPGEYIVKVNDGSSKEDLVFNSVSLTGNVVGLESVVGTNFWDRYPLVSLFFITLIIVAFIVATLRFRQKFSKKKVVKKRN